MAEVTITLSNIDLNSTTQKFTCQFTASPSTWPSGSETDWCSSSGNIDTPPHADTITLELEDSTSVPSPTFKKISIDPVAPTTDMPFTIPTLSGTSSQAIITEQSGISAGTWHYTLTITVNGTDYEHDPRIYNNGSGVIGNSDPLVIL